MERLKREAPSGMTMAQMAMRWILDYDAVSVVIPRARNIDQVQSNVSASDLPSLSVELHEGLARFYEREVAEHIRGPY